MSRYLTTWAVLASLLVGCETAPPAMNQPGPAVQTQRTNAPASSGPIAYIHGEPVTDADLHARLVEAAGGQVLSELVLDKMIRDRLTQRGLTLTPEMIALEKSHMLSTLSADPNEAVRLLNKMRRDRGLGEQRFQSMIYRNAGLRRLVQNEVQVPPALVRQAFELRYGQRYRVRIIVTDSLPRASVLRKRAVEGESFADLASLNSTDASAAQGGLLTPISLVDPTYPKAMRQALSSMQPGGISDLIAADDRFIIMELEATLPAEPILFEEVREELERSVRLEVEGQRMQQTARSMLQEAKVVVLEPVLNKSWLTQKTKLQGE